MMNIHILTLFPEMFEAFANTSIIGRAINDNKIKFVIHDLRQWGKDKRKTVDDKPYGGGPGMVLMIEPIYQAISDIVGDQRDNFTVILTSAKGQKFVQNTAQTLSTSNKDLLIICGHYEGVDERVAEHLIDLELSIGDYVLTGGELAAQVIADATIRLLPGVLGNDASLADESHNDHNYTERGHYTRPETFVTPSGESWQVPPVLLSGNHKQIEQWRSGKI